MKKSWQSVAIAAAIIAGAAAVVFIAAGAFVVYHHTDARFVSAVTAGGEFERVDAQFRGTRPLVELRGVDPPIVQRDDSSPRHPVRTLHVLSYDPRSHKLVRVDLPGWVLEWVSARGRIRVANLETFDDWRDRLTLEDIERHTPGVIVSGTGRSRVLVWTE